MTIGIELGSITDEIGTADFLRPFFQQFLDISKVEVKEVVFHYLWKNFTKESCLRKMQLAPF
jgi:hypothetical protein